MKCPSSWWPVKGVVRCRTAVGDSATSPPAISLPVIFHSIRVGDGDPQILRTGWAVYPTEHGKTHYRQWICESVGTKVNVRTEHAETLFNYCFFFVLYRVLRSTWGTLVTTGRCETIHSPDGWKNCPSGVRDPVLARPSTVSTRTAAASSRKPPHSARIPARKFGRWYKDNGYAATVTFSLPELWHLNGEPPGASQGTVTNAYWRADVKNVSGGREQARRRIIRRQWP